MTPFARIVTITKNPWVLIGYLVWVIFTFYFLDKPIAYYCHELREPWALVILHGLTQLGLTSLYIIALFLFAVLFRYIYQEKIWEMRAWFLWLSVLIPNLVCLILKMLCGRSRPELLFSKHLYGFYGFQKNALFWSFPSGHTSTIMGLAFGFSALFPRYTYLYILTGICLIATRILLTQHFLSDILVALYLALLEVGLLFWWFQRKQLLPLSSHNKITNRLYREAAH